MSTVSQFEDLKVWQKARELNKLVYTHIVKNVALKDYAYKDQINRSAGSVMDNIAEGFDRNGNKEFRQYLAISKGSCAEVRSQLIRGLDRNYISTDAYQELSDLALSTSKMISGLIKYINKSEFKGSKFSEPSNLYQSEKP